MAKAWWNRDEVVDGEKDERTVEQKLIDIQEEATEVLEKATRALEFLKKNPEIQFMKELGVI